MPRRVLVLPQLPVARLVTGHEQRDKRRRQRKEAMKAPRPRAETTMTPGYRRDDLERHRVLHRSRCSGDQDWQLTCAVLREFLNAVWLALVSSKRQSSPLFFWNQTKPTTPGWSLSH